MKYVSFLLLILITCWSCKNQNKEDLTQYVNPLIGTYNDDYGVSYGNLYPAISLPFGMNCWTVQEAGNFYGWGYTWQRNKICGFKQTHQPSPWINDYACFSLMPVTGNPDTFEVNNRYAEFSHADEIARPYYYSVVLNESKTKIEFSPTERAVLFRFSFGENPDNYIVIDAFPYGSMLRWDKKENRITGYCYGKGSAPEPLKNYFVIEFDSPVKSCVLAADKEILSSDNTTAAAGHVLAKLGFSSDSKVINARIASSFVSEEQAQLNLKRELGNSSLEEISDQGKKVWNKYLHKIEVEGGTEEQTRTFYSCFYRSLLFPRNFYEYNEQNKPVYCSPYDGKLYEGYMLTDNGFWDTFRGAHPLLTLVCPSHSSKVMKSLVSAWEQSGYLPQWASPGHVDCMIGNNSNALIADAYIKGIRDFDVNRALDAMVSDADRSHPAMSSVGRLGFPEYNSKGYVPCDKYKEATARTLEYAYNDFCIAEVAKAIGRDDIADRFYRQSYNYRNVFDSSVGWMRGRNDDGSWRADFDPCEWGGPFTEGNSLHYTWSVFHNISDLIRLMGGKDIFLAKMDSIFSMPPRVNTGSYRHMIHEMTEMVNGNMGQYAHGNQPIQHFIYLYNHAGHPEKAQYWVREVMDRFYNSTEKGYCGDEDNGQTSSWFVMSAMGFYSVSPGTSQYVLGSPLFKRITLNLENGNTFVISAPENSTKNRYVGEMTLNGKPYTKLFIDYSVFINGGTLNLKMLEAPAQKTIQKEDLPFSRDNY